MPKLWLTYAWRDNADANVDFVAQEIRGLGIEVGMDRFQLQTGGRLWEQLATEIAAPATDAWAIYVTPASLESQPCREEISYALQRALETRDAAFPLIGILPERVDNALMPMVLKTRLYVSLRDPDWKERVRSGVLRQPPNIHFPSIDPVVVRVLQETPEFVIEVRPRIGAWFPGFVGIPTSEMDKFIIAAPGAAGSGTGIGLSNADWRKIDDGTVMGIFLNHEINSTTSMFIRFRRRPTRIDVGSPTARYTLTWQ